MQPPTRSKNECCLSVSVDMHIRIQSMSDESLMIFIAFLFLSLLIIFVLSTFLK